MRPGGSNAGHTVLKANRSAEALRLLALRYSAEGKEEEAEQILRQLARRHPEQAMVRADLGVCLFRGGQWAAAAREFHRALLVDPDDGETAVYLANALRLSGQTRASLDVFRKLIDAGWADPVVLEGFYRAALEGGDLEGILPDMQRLLKRKPRLSLAHGIAGEIHFEHGRGDKGCDHLAREGRLSDAAVDSIRIYYMLGEPSSTAEQEKRVISRWVERYTKAPERAPAVVRRRGRGRLRVGYLTGEFTRVPAWYFVFPMVRYHDPAVVSVYGYHSRKRMDDRTKEFESYCTAFQHVASWSDDHIAERIRRDRIDVLVDLSGHFDDQRLAVFRHRPAPVSFAYPNHPSTTGVREIDYIFTDRWIDPPGSASKYVEQPWHLESGCVPFLGLEGAPEVSEPPAMRNGYITFGVLQKSLKLNDVVWDLLAGAMRATPGSRLILRYNCADLDNPRSAASQRIRGEFGKRGVAGSRIFLGSLLPRTEYLAQRREFDIALDTFPYNGQTTTCDSFWMGVPTVTMAGETHVSRVGYSLLARMGMEEWVATSVEEYAAIAGREAANLERLSELRRTLRGRVQKALNPVRFGREVEQAFLTARRQVGS